MSGGRYALIVVTSEYQDPHFSQLRAVGTDAFRLNDVLSDPVIGGYNVYTMADRRTWEINVAIDRFFTQNDPDDLRLFYISGHGVKDDSGQLYFATHDTDFNLLASTGVSSAFVRERMTTSRSRRIFALIDCCFSGAFGGLATKGAGGVDVASFAEGTGCVILTASNSIEYSFVSGELADRPRPPRPSVFTDAVVRGLRTGAADRNRDGAVDVDELFDYIYQQVRQDSEGKQTPTKHGQNIQGTLEIAKSPTPPPPPPAPPPTPTPTPPESPPEAQRPRWLIPVLVSVAVLLIAVGVPTYFIATGSTPPPTASPTPTVNPTRVTPTPTPTPTVTRFDAWQASSMPKSVEAAGAAVHGGRVWLLGGHSPDAEAIKTVQRLDPISGQWLPGPDLPKALHDVGAVSDGRDLYAIGGETADDTVVDTVYRLERDNSGWSLQRSLPAARAAGGVVWNGSSIIYAGGVDAQKRDVADVYALEPSGWVRVGALKTARNSIAAASDGRGTAWFMTGQTGWSQLDKISGQVDVLTDKTIAPGPPVTSRRAAAAVYLAGIGPCVLGGAGNERGLPAVVECPLNRSRARPPDLPTPRAGLAAVISNGQIWTFGGFSPDHIPSSSVVEKLPFRTS